MPRGEEQNRELRDRRRQAILQAALDVFVRLGPASARTADIARAAGVSQGLLYHYFPSKDAVLEALVERALGGALRLTEEALALDAAPWERLRFLCERWLQGLRRGPQFMVLVAQTFGAEGVPAAVHAILRERGRQIFENVVRLVRDGQAAGRVAAGDPAEMAQVLAATIQGLALRRAQARAGAEEPVPRVETVLRLLAAREEERP